VVVQLTITAPGQGLHDITHQVEKAVADAARSGALAADRSGLATIFIRHTSASLVIQENAAPSARQDLEHWLNRLVPENDPAYTHDEEGPDDMPAHIKAALTATSISIPIMGGKLGLGTWQGIYLWEHRRSPRPREILVHIAP